ncbi:MAG: rod shape-determining protein MreC [Propionibacteriales bacterium]|nr:rod shape-determining protein MreC [Propionibacteriales bacterium]
MRPDERRGARRPHTVVALLVLASFTVITLDARPSGDSPVDPLRSTAGAVFGPMETGASAAVSPLTAIPRYFGDVSDLRTRNTELEDANARLESELRTSALARQRAGELDDLLGVTEDEGYRLVPAQVVAIGAAQAFSRTVTIDAGRGDGVRPDMTVLNGQGLVGRVIDASRSTATVLLAIDPDSVVGGRLGRTMELGFVSGDGEIGEDGRLTLELVDDVVEPRIGDTVATWGSRGGAPYVAGVPIGEVTKIESSPRELSKSVVLTPYVDYSSLDLVGVVVGTDSADGRVPVDTAARSAR